MSDRVILVGFMGSGKSTVGALLAERLGWDFVDFDERIEREQGRSIREIFRDEGEPFFRSLEAELTERVKDRREIVLAPGGGWITQPDLVERLRGGSRMIWLRVSPDVAYRRCGERPGQTRPLLATDAPLETIRAMLAARRRLYEQADAWVDTDARTPREVADEIERLLREE